MSNKYVKANFTLDNYEEGFIGYHDPSQHWNGWATPSFTLEETRRLMANMKDQSKDDEWIFWHNAVLWYSASDNYVEAFQAEIITDENGKEIEVYPIGSGMWTWIAHPVIDVYTITKDDIERVATFADLNDALKLLQRNIGQKDGGIAAQVFSSHKHLPDGNTEEWFNASYDERIVMLLDYLRYEKESAQRNDEEPKFKLDWKD